MPSRQHLANAIRALSMDAVQQANSGHPGMPMGMADIAEVLWNDFMVHNPSNPQWANRDRFILSNGHGCMLHYSLLHLSGYDLSIDDIKQFRQLHSKTPGHPEYGCAPGIETTTGPLGQGLATAVGMALAERTLAAQFNQPKHALIDHYTYVFAGDGCLMEGISHEACSLAGTLGLGKLIVFYDDNQISIDGDTRGWFTDNTEQRFHAYNWHVIDNVDGHDADAIKAAIKEARSVTDKPSIICCKTVIGYGSPKLAGSEKTHGAPLGADEIAATRDKLGWHHPAFEIPSEVYASWDAREKGTAAEQQWQTQFDKYQHDHSQLAEELLRRLAGELPSNWAQVATNFVTKNVQEAESIASRKASQKTLNAFGPSLPELIGGSADLTGSNLTLWQDSKVIDHDNADGNYIYYGVREFAMSAMMNGLALHGGFIPYAGTFLVFTDYARNAVRLSALMKQRVIYVYTHDSIGLGEDGPTHQPIEHLGMLRMTPNMSVWRPCDTVETAVAWQKAIENTDGPTSLIFSRQTVEHEERDSKTLTNIERGGYTLKDCDGEPQAIIIATGSEVSIAVAAWQQLTNDNIRVQVVSMPCMEAFDQQSGTYQQQVLPATVTARVAIEAAASAPWYKYVGLQGKVIGIDRFGESAPYKEIYQALGLTSDAIVESVKQLINQ